MEKSKKNNTTTVPPSSGLSLPASILINVVLPVPDNTKQIDLKNVSHLE